MCPSSQILVVSWYRVACETTGRAAAAACVCRDATEAVQAVYAGNQYVGKQWKIREAVDLGYPAQK